MMNRPRTTHVFRLRPLKVAPAALGLLLLALVAAVGAAPGANKRVPDLGDGDCQKLQVPEGNKVALRTFGVGVQIYRWDGMNWVFLAPEATLFANAGDNGEVGTHFGGPTWQSNSG